MQFHHNGYVSEDPRVLPAQGYGVDRDTELPDEMDVLIVGSGPHGHDCGGAAVYVPKR